MIKITEERLADLDRWYERALAVGPGNPRPLVVLTAQYPDLAATVREQAAEIERLRATEQRVRRLIDHPKDAHYPIVARADVRSALDGPS